MGLPTVDYMKVKYCVVDVNVNETDLVMVLSGVNDSEGYSDGDFAAAVVVVVKTVVAIDTEDYLGGLINLFVSNY